MEEQCAKLGALALPPMRGVVEPDRGVDADAEATKVGGVGLETIDDGDVGERP